jgi:hypothetical protein
VNITQRRRANLEKLAATLESLPADYAHFEMSEYIGHEGSCDTIEEGLEEEVFVADGPQVFLSNCGAVACAIGHAPAAGIPLSKSHIGKTEHFDWRKRKTITIADIDWDAYANYNFFPTHSDAWEWCFSGEWAEFDNHHYGAAARIRYLLDKGAIPTESGSFCSYFYVHRELVDLYAPYRIDAQKVAA